MILQKKVLFLIAIFVITQASAETNFRSAAEAKIITNNYAAITKKTPPTQADYHYGMKLDIDKLIHVSRSELHCGNIYSFMSYEDGQGKLHLVRYLVNGNCNNDN